MQASFKKIILQKMSDDNVMSDDLTTGVPLDDDLEDEEDDELGEVVEDDDLVSDDAAA